jgi:Tol biopolymer transport system component
MSSLHRRPGFLLALGLCVIGGAVTLLGHLAVGTQTAPVRLQLPNVAGTEACPSFSPNGRHLAYSARGSEAGDSFHIWVRALPAGAPQQLTAGAGNDVCPVWSPDGSGLAFLRETDEGGQYIVIPAAGGSERKVTETATPEEGTTVRSAVAWMRDGKSLVFVKAEEKRPPSIFAVSLENGAERQLTDPPADSPGDSNPAVSPDGQTVAFVRGIREEAADVWLCDANGKSLRQLTFNASPTRGVTWTPDGHDVVYAANRMSNNWKLWRIPAFGGSPREVYVGASVANDPAIAPEGHRLAYTQTPSMSAIWLANLPAGKDPHTRPIIRSSGREASPSWSPDGRKIAWVSDRSGSDQIWVSDADGSNESQVTNAPPMSLTGPRWFPDGSKLLFSSRGVPQNVFTVPAASRMAQPKPLPLSPGANLGWISLSHDGKSDYAEWRGVIWKFSPGKEPRQLTEHMGAGLPEESVDGKYVYYSFRRAIWRVPSGSGAEEEVATPEQFISSLQPVANGIYYMGWEGRRRVSIWFYDFAAKRSAEVLRLNDAEISREARFDVSPDGKYLLYPKIDRAETDLVLVENFR